MFQSQRFCIIKGHENFQTSHICTFKECDQISRWVCVECTSKQLHQHQQLITNHIMNKQEFTIYINQQVNYESKVQKEEIQFYITKLHKIKKQIKQLQEYFTSFHEIFDNQDVSQVQQILKEDYLSLSSEQISKAIKKLNSIQADYHRNLVIDFIKSIQSQLNVAIDINSQNIEKQAQNIDENLTITNYLELQQNQQILSAQISPNEQYLAYGGKQKLLMIYNLKSKQLIRDISLDQMVYACEFSEDSQQLYVGCQNGYLCCFDSCNNFRQTCYQQIHDDNIYGLTQKQNYLITSCKTDIIVTDYKSLSQVKKIRDVHSDCINGIDYNIINDIILSCSQDKSIKLVQGKDGQVIINKQNAHIQGIDQIKFINNLKIVSLDQNNILKQWQIDYFNKDIKCINQLEDVNFIYNFINTKLNLITICQNFVKIYDDNFQFKSQLSHPQGDNVWHEYQVIELTKFFNYSWEIKINYPPSSKKQMIYFIKIIYQLKDLTFAPGVIQNQTKPITYGWNHSQEKYMISAIFILILQNTSMFQICTVIFNYYINNINRAYSYIFFIIQKLIELRYKQNFWKNPVKKETQVKIQTQRYHQYRSHHTNADIRDQNISSMIQIDTMNYILMNILISVIMGTSKPQAISHIKRQNEYQNLIEYANYLGLINKIIYDIIYISSFRQMDETFFYNHEMEQHFQDSFQYNNCQQQEDLFENQSNAEELNQQNLQYDNQNHTKYNTTYPVTKELTTEKIASLKKNFPKTVCNNLRKYLQYKTYQTHAITQFINKKQINKQAKYTIEDLRTLCYDRASQQIVYHYMTNCAFIDIICSDKVEYPEQYIELIEHFVQGCLSPQNFICNKKTLKQNDSIL